MGGTMVDGREVSDLANGPVSNTTESLPAAWREVAPLIDVARDAIMRRDIAFARADALAAHSLATVAFVALRHGVVRRSAQALSLERNTLCEYAPLARWPLEKLVGALEYAAMHGHSVSLACRICGCSPLYRHLLVTSYSKR